MIDSGWRSLRYFDWLSFTLTFIIATIGLIFIFSATYTPEYPCSLFFQKQLAGLLVGCVIYFTCALIDHRILMHWGYFGYFGVIGLLCFTLIKGTIGMGAQRWVNLFFFKLQPSELVKLFSPAFCAYYFFNQKNKLFNTKTFIPIIGILSISFLLIMKQPDLGTALIILFSGAIILWLAGINKKFFIIAFIASTLCAPLLWHILKPYQKKRISVFLGEGQLNKERYQIEQATIAIGSGGLTGKGFLQGTQNKLRFLPEGRTDFIFAVACEETGFIGALFIICLYLLLFFRLKKTICDIAVPHIQLLATGLITPIILSALINMGMVLNLLPIVGIPLPLMSYGLSNLWVTLASLGWFQSIAMRERS